MKKIQLIQPRHIYAPKDIRKYGHIYMPTSLITIASVLNEAKVPFEIIDENLTSNYELNSIVGINLLGAPYIPIVKEFESRLKKKFKKNYTLFIGGQIVNGLSNLDFNRLFGKNTFNGNNYNILFSFFNKSIPEILENKLSHIPIFDKISDEYMKLYLGKEISLYLSQGCKYSCTFCSAQRTKDVNGIKVIKKEIYREVALVSKDLRYLINKAKQFNYNKLTIYISNLDLFQSPKMLEIFVTEIERIESLNNFKIDFRGLATVASFLKLYKINIELLNRFKKIGLSRVGYGIDGATAEVYKKTKKPQTSKMCLDAIELTHKLGITPETLMVFGHNNKEDENSLKKAVDFCKIMYEKYNSFSRPHISKDIVPGNDGWNYGGNIEILNQFYDDILLFQNLDFTALPSKFTHPDEEFRELVSKYFIEICNLPNSLTQYVKPYNKNHSYDEKNKTQKFNEGRYDI